MANKTIESILKPVRVLDEYVLRQYTKVTQKWEKKGRSRYSLSSAVGMPAKIPLIGGLTNFIGMGAIPLETVLYNWDWAYNLTGLGEKINQETDGEAKIVD